MGIDRAEAAGFQTGCTTLSASARPARSSRPVIACARPRGARERERSLRGREAERREQTGDHDVVPGAPIAMDPVELLKVDVRSRTPGGMGEDARPEVEG